MRTTISLDDRLAARVKKCAAAAGQSVSAFIAGILDDALKRSELREAPPFRLVTVDGHGVREGVDLDQPRTLDVAGDEAFWSRSARTPAEPPGG